MRNERLTKADVYGWLKELGRWKSEVEEKDRKKRKTILYWIRI